MESLVKIQSMSMVSEDVRGITAEFALPRKQKNFILITRKAGSLSGNTYHEGKNPETRPKVFVLLTGKIRFSYRKIGTDVRYEKEIIAPAVIEISPFVTHKVEALEDFVLLEGNSIQDIQQDRIREEV